MININTFKTRSRANEGVRLPLCTPEGAETDHWIQVKGIDSDAFSKAVIDRQEDSIRLQDIEDNHEKEQALLNSTCELLASIVCGWSFSSKKLHDPPIRCTPENVKEFLLDAPQIRDQIDKLISDRESFFGAQSKS